MNALRIWNVSEGKSSRCRRQKTSCPKGKGFGKAFRAFRPFQSGSLRPHEGGEGMRPEILLPILKAVSEVIFALLCEEDDYDD